jgi:hypothetical protein
MLLRAETSFKIALCNFIASIAPSRQGKRREYRAKSLRFTSYSTWLLLLLSSGLCVALSGCIADAVNRLGLQTLVASASSVDLGNVTVGNGASASVSLVNSNSVPVKITQVSLIGLSFSIAGQGSLPVSVAAGGTYSLKVNFDPAAVGPAAGQLTITSDASTTTTLISLSGTGAAEAQPAVQLSAIACSSASMTGSGTDACTVTIGGAAPAGGFNVSLSSSNAAVSAPATVTVKANATTAQLTANVLPVSAAQAVQLTASAGSITTSFALELNAAIPTLSIGATSVAFGDVVVNEPATESVTMKSTGTAPVTISAATITGAGFTLARNTFPVSLSPGQSATLGVQFDPAAAGAAAGQLTVTSNSSIGSSAAISLSGTGTEAQAAVQLSAIACSSASMTGSGTDACTVTIGGAAPAGGFNVSLSSSNAAVSAPATVTVKANATTAQFTANVLPVSAAQAVKLTASAGSITTSFALELNAAIPTLSIGATSVAFGNVVVNTPATQSVTLTATGTAPVTISAATITGAGFTMARNTFPVSLSPGQSATLGVQFDPAAAGAAAGQLTVTSNSSIGSSAAISLSGTGTEAQPAVQLSAIACSSASMTGSGTDACTVTIGGAAPAGGFNVSLSSSNAAVSAPATVTVKANATTAQFTANVLPVSTAQAVKLTASAGSITTSFALELNAAIPTLSIGATSVAFGDVVVNEPATESVTMKSTGTAPVTISAATITGAGFTMARNTFPVSLSPGQSATLGVQFDPAAEGVATGQLTITSNSSTGGTAVVSLSGTGTAAPEIVVGVTPANVSTAAGTTQQFDASVTGTSNTAVAWTVSGDGCSGAACGIISSSGLYTAPATAPSPATVTVTATSESEPTKSASADVTIVPVGTTYYLATATDGGNNSNDGLSLSTPWLSPNHSVNCGDVILAAPSTAYSASNFATGAWGTVTCPAGNNVAWLKCATFDTCKISSSALAGMWVDHSYWGVQGWEVTTTAGDTQGTCFLAEPAYVAPVQIHHVIFANDVANGCGYTGFQTGNIGSAGVDYIAIVGSIAYNAAQGSLTCNNGLDIYQPIQSDALPGTHIYLAGNFMFGNFDPNPCGGIIPGDGEGITLDTWDGSAGGPSSPYAGQGVVDNNILVANGGRGLLAGDNGTGAPPFAQIYLRHNTMWGNNLDLTQAGGSSSSWCGEVDLLTTLNTEAFFNIAVTNATDGCGAKPIYAFYVTGASTADSVYQNWGYAASGTNDAIFDSPGFSYDPTNTFGTNPSFANPVAPEAPSCGNYSSVPACMATVIANFAPTNAAASGYGYQIPSSAQTHDPLFPQWLCNVNLPAGLVTMGCKAEP